MSLSYFHFLPARSRVGVKDLNLHAKVNIVKVAAGFVRERDLYEFLELNYLNILFPHAPQIIEQETNIWHFPCISIYNLKISNSVLNHFTLYICSAKRSRPWFIRYFICASSCQREGAYFFSRRCCVRNLWFPFHSVVYRAGVGAFNAPHNSDLCVSYERIFCHLFIHLRRLVIRAAKARARFLWLLHSSGVSGLLFSRVGWDYHELLHRQQFAVQNNELWKLGRHSSTLLGIGVWVCVISWLIYGSRGAPHNMNQIVFYVLV